MNFPIKVLIPLGINRNIVECKDVYEVNATRADQVLIETLWNVKIKIEEMRKRACNVLIETLWNVKKEGNVLWIDVVPY